MTSLIAPISSLLAGVALLLLGHGLLNTLLTLRGVAEGYSTGMVGLLMSGYFAGFLIGTWLAPSLIRRIGHIRTFSFYASVAATAVLLHVMIVNPWVWLVLRLVYGIALVTLYMVIESWLNAQVSGESAARYSPCAWQSTWVRWRRLSNCWGSTARWNSPCLPWRPSSSAAR